MSAASLAADLRALGVACDIEERGKLAIARVHDDATQLRDEALRRRVTRLLHAHGFTHLALELSDDDDPGEALSRG